MVADPVTDSIARPVSRTTAPPIPIRPQDDAKRRRLRLLDGVVTAGVELLAIGDRATGALVASRAYGQAADAHVDSIDARAQRIAAWAAANGHRAVWHEAVAIRQDCAAYHADDDEEDRLRDEHAGGLLTTLRRIVRGLNMALSWHLAKRGAVLRKDQAR